ncbi:hypothetical protein BIU82_02770 [Arthrobacter sp. SW1]|uniref:universal stress protein n=1 Tax=Arthrobacter sp. SW1 TaxID=1920889 RepID=UPI000877CF0F|nr:universal stress protein [Arthrobacter sp. SW1]OFI39977.1 hypothetical protein BIU82_02770 [Arthrobacter sp. SW1]
MTEALPAPGPVLAGVVPGQPAAIIRHAAELARGSGSRLLLAYVDPSLEDARRPIDPDGVDDAAAGLADGFRDRIAARLQGTGVEWSFTVLAGDPVHELLRYAQDAGASVIVVGSREHGLGRYLENLAGGSLGERLARHGGPPVIIVPGGKTGPTADPST